MGLSDQTEVEEGAVMKVSQHVAANYNIVHMFDTERDSELMNTFYTLIISYELINKGRVKFYRIPRPGFGKNLPEKSFRPLF